MHFRILNLVMLCGCQGVNGGGWASYLGRKISPKLKDKYVAVAKTGKDHHAGLQKQTSWFYFATDQMEI